MKLIRNLVIIAIVCVGFTVFVDKAMDLPVAYMHEDGTIVKATYHGKPISPQSIKGKRYDVVYVAYDDHDYD